MKNIFIRRVVYCFSLVFSQYSYSFTQSGCKNSIISFIRNCANLTQECLLPSSKNRDPHLQSLMRSADSNLRQLAIQVVPDSVIKDKNKKFQLLRDAIELHPDSTMLERIISRTESHPFTPGEIRFLQNVFDATYNISIKQDTDLISKTEMLHESFLQVSYGLTSLSPQQFLTFRDLLKEALMHSTNEAFLVEKIKNSLGSHLGPFLDSYSRNKLDSKKLIAKAFFTLSVDDLKPALQVSGHHESAPEQIARILNLVK